MKFKVISLILVMLFVSGVCFASDSISKNVYSYPVTNSTATRQISIISTSIIRPKIDKIIGYSIQPLTGKSAESYISLFDQTAGYLSGESFCETEASQGEGRCELWPFGKYISNGVVVAQGANTQVQVYFTKE